MTREELQRALSDPKPEARIAALSALRPSDIGDDLLPSIVGALDDEGAIDVPTVGWDGVVTDVVRVADVAHRKLEAMGMSAVQPLVRAVAAGAGRRTRATLATLVIGHEHRLSEPMLRELRDGTASREDADSRRLHRRAALEAERRAGLAGSPARLERLAAALGERGDVARDAVWALGHAKGSHVAAQALLTALHRPIPGLGDALFTIGPVLPEREQATLFEAVARSPGSELLRAAAAYDVPPVAEILVARLESSSRHVRREEAELLGRMTATESVRPRLVSLLCGDDSRGRFAAWVALGRAEGLREPELAAFLERQHAALRDPKGLLDVTPIAELGPRAGALLPSLLATLDGLPSESTRLGHLLLVLSSLGEAARPGVRHVVRHLSTPAGAHHALVCLKRLGPIAAEAQDAVREAIDRAPSRPARERAEATLRAILAESER